MTHKSGHIINRAIPLTRGHLLVRDVLALAIGGGFGLFF